jgi:hypothetical protein
MNFDQKELRSAIHASLWARPVSAEAEAIVATLTAMLSEHALASKARKNKRDSTAEKLSYATGAFLADLLRPYDHTDPKPSPWVYRSMHAKSFTNKPVTYRIFVSLIDGLKGLGLLQQVEGHKVSAEPEDTGKFGARFRATPALLRFCSERAVDPANVLDYFEFEYDLPKEVLERRAKKEGGYWLKTKPVGKSLPFERDGVTKAIEGNVRELNEFFKQQKLRGGSHHGYVRIYHNGDDPNFFWNMGGRLYSQHTKDSYQVKNGGERRRMTINGEPVAEIDIRASYLTIFLSMHGIQLPEGDPYELPGLGPEHRTAVKSWMVGTFGNAKAIVRWPSRMLKDDPELKQYRVSNITKAALAKYPALAEWGEAANWGVFGNRIHNWADLMWIESNVMLSTMLKLMREHRVPSLSVHDSLVVPAIAAETTTEVLKESFRSNLHVTPLLKINPPTPPEREKVPRRY